MNNFIIIQCPCCAESFEVAIDVSEGNAEFIMDCEIWCRPMTVNVRIHRGEIDGLDVNAA